MVVMRIKALDKDLEFTDNWLAVFDIHKGNEDNLFSIETDPKTNEGILKLIKVPANAFSLLWTFYNIICLVFKIKTTAIHTKCQYGKNVLIS